jgi:hypothetical protein
MATRLLGTESMLDIERAMSQDRSLRALTGMNIQAFVRLMIPFYEAYQAAQTGESKLRQRAKGAGRKAKLESIEAKLFFILFYFKCYPTFDVAGILFEMDRSQANRWVHRLQSVLETALGKKMALPERKLESFEQFVQRFPEVREVIIDGTERPIQRPTDTDQQVLNYSGKKKRHTRKHLAVVDPNKRVLVLTKAREGKVHDKRLLDDTEIAASIPTEIPITADLGFQGLQNQYDNIRLPHKKPKKRELSDAQKQENRDLSQYRVRGEHAFAGIKRYSAVSQIYRNRVADFDDHLMVTATGLWNFYLMAA